MVRVVNVKQNSVRIETGLVAFDVLVCVDETTGIKYIKKPKGIYLLDHNMRTLVRTVLDAYETTVENKETVDATKKGCKD